MLQYATVQLDLMLLLTMHCTSNVAVNNAVRFNFATNNTL